MTTNTTSRRTAEHTRALILAALAEATAPVTVADLADQAGVAKSTLGRHLPALEQEGKAVRTPGGRDGRRRLPDEWTHAGTTAEDTGPEADTGEAGLSGERVTHPASEAVAPEGEASTDADADTGAGAGHTTTEVTGDPDTETFIPGLGTVPEVELDALSGGATGARVQEPSAPAARAGGAPKAAAPSRTGTTRVGARPGGEANPVSGSTRLAPGELKLMVKAILDSDPGEEFAATAISHILQGRSIGAIQNNLARLAKEGHAVQTCAKPRRYRSAKHAG